MATFDRYDLTHGRQELIGYQNGLVEQAAGVATQVYYVILGAFHAQAVDRLQKFGKRIYCKFIQTQIARGRFYHIRRID